MNPKYQTVLNHVCYPSLTDLPEAPDVVVFSIRKPLLPEQVRLAVKRGARAAVIYDAGFAELGEEGARQQAEIAGLCREAGMPVCGPNCMGILNPTARVTTYKQTLMDTNGLAGNVGFISQSGSVVIAILSDLRRYGISLSVSAGNEAVTRTVDYIEYLIDDPATKVIATFTETVREPERYVAALDRAAAVGKPVVVLKVGRTERTQRAITSHTGGLAGESRVFSEMLRAHRAIEVADLDEMTEVLAVCQGERWPRGRGISVITGSGGLAEMILDNATAAGLDLPPLSGAERSEAEQVIGRITGDGNPFDAWGNGNYAVNLPHAMSVVDKSERIDAVVYCADTSNEGHVGHPGRVLENVKMLADAAKSSHKPYYLMSSRPGVMNAQQAKGMRDAGLVQIGGTRQGLGAIDHIGRYMMPQKPFRTSANRSGAQLAPLLGAKPGRRTINEYESKQLLSAFGVPVTREQRVATPDEATHAARAIGYPVVLKVVSDEIPHKTELGLVAVGLAGDDDLSRAFERLQQRLERVRATTVRRRFPGAGIRRRRGRGIRRHLARSGFRADAGVRYGRDRDRDHPRLCAPHPAAARRRRRGDDRRDPRRRHAGPDPRPARGRRRQPGRLPLCACRLRPSQCRYARRDRPQPDQGAARGSRLRRGGRLDRRETANARLMRDLSSLA